jgi:hypothetical protein
MTGGLVRSVFSDQLIVIAYTLSAAFPVFVVDLDFSVMMDTTTLTAIKGSIVEKKV